MTVKENLTPEVRAVIANALTGESLYALVADCINKMDFDMLRTLKDEGRFDLTPADIMENNVNMREHDEAFMTPRAFPMVDALANILYQQTDASHSYAKWHGDNTNRQTVSWTWYSPPSDLKFIVGEILYDVVDKFRELASTFSTTSLVIPMDFSRFRMNTLAVIAAIGCANNDVGLVKACLAQEPDVLSVRLKADPLIKKDSTFHSKVVCPHIFALYFGADKVLDFLGPKHFKSVLTEADICSPYHLANAGRPRKPESLGDLMNNFNGWRRPDLAASAIGLLVGENGKVLREHVDYVNDSLVPQISGGDAQHLLDMALEKFPGLFEFGKKEAEKAAKMHRIPELLKLFIKEMDFPRPLDPSKHHVCFEGYHPIEQIVTAPAEVGGAGRDPDACFLMIIAEMTRRGIEKDLFDTCHETTGVSFAHVAAANNWQRSIAKLIQSGMDFGLENKNGEKPADVADKWGHTESGDLIRSATAAQEAMKVLSELQAELGMEFGVKKHVPV